MKKITMIMLAILTLGFTACQWPENPIPEEYQPVAKTIAKIALRAAVYGVVQNNPDLAPWVNGVAAVMADTEQSLSPEQVRLRIVEYINQIDGIKEGERMLLAQTAMTASDFYLEVYAASNESLVEPELAQLLNTLAKVMEEGVQLALAGTDPNAPVASDKIEPEIVNVGSVQAVVY